MTEKPENRRSIRSFVRRTGRLTPSQERALKELWPLYGIDVSDAPLDFAALFGRDALRTLEIGFGNGETLVEQARERPEQDFIGIEVHEPGVGHCLLGIHEAELDNLRLISFDAIEVLRQQIPPSSLSRINLYFPDPWPKKRHHKRRIVAPAFLELCALALCDGGTLHIATDWDNYALHIEETLAAAPGFECQQKSRHTGEQPLDRPRTKFERRGLLRGHTIHDWIFVAVQ